MPEIKPELLRGDITKLDVDAVVNAANSGLMGGGGVDGAIHRAAGPALLAECMEIARAAGNRAEACPAGEAVVTGAGNLPCKKVIHTVGPVWRGGAYGEAGLLASCYRKSLLLAQREGLASIAFPNISTGVYGYPKNKAAETAVLSVMKTLAETPGITRVIFVCFDEENLSIYRKLLAAV
ncbi:MAG: O-acetyl-ADP-ribose deacetylase [Treponema sp.]|jgi:O-acetyl-ADP-ribose deacetylase (regulator of RNase III)|nr:O-acetyl-ADP-ribose deacetylase [Treponema sp.]